MAGHITIRDVNSSDLDWVRVFLVRQFGSTRIVTRGVLHHADKLPGLIALYDGQPEALLTYSYRADELEIVSLHSARIGVGLGSTLIDAARERAMAFGCRRMWLVTTNDNEPAIRFYQQRGMRIAAIHYGAIAESRKLKPEISFIGVGGRPIEDEVELELLLRLPELK